MSESTPRLCSFCEQPVDETRGSFSSAKANICFDCVEMCLGAVALRPVDFEAMVERARHAWDAVAPEDRPPA